jgi:amino acid transporter
MKKKVGLVVFSVLALLGTFLPVASAGGFYIGISGLKGLSLLLYLVAFALLVLSILNIYKEVKYINTWFIGTSVLGLVVLLFTTLAGINTLNYIIQEKLAIEKKMSDFNKKFEEEQRKFEEEFNKGWGDSDGLKSDEKVKSENNAESQQIQNSQQMTAPSAGPDIGTYLMALGFLGMLGLSLFPERKEQQTA